MSKIKRIGALSLALFMLVGGSSSYAFANEISSQQNDEATITDELENTLDENEIIEVTMEEEPNVQEFKEEVKNENLTLFSLVPGANVTIDNVTDLKDSIEQAEQNKTITLSNTFDLATLQNVTINKSNSYDVTVDFGNKEVVSANVAQLTISSNAGGNLILKNLNIDGAGQVGGVVINANNVTLMDGTINNCAYGAVSANGSNILLTNMNFSGNNGLNGAVGVAGNSVTISHSTFTNNGNPYGGYNGGAIAGKYFSGSLTINNSKFIGNTATGTGAVTGGRGGAIAIDYPGASANITVKDCYFEGNQAAPNNNSDFADGGAIAIFDMAAGGKFTADGCTFYNNIAGDDGGAILLQAKGGAKNFLVNNCTFYKNEARGKETSANSGYTGGAVQVYSNALRADAVRSTQFDFTNNTFYENTAKANYAGQDQKGGAVTSSGGTWGLLGGIRGVFQNNLFISNHVEKDPGVENTDSAYANVYFSSVTNNGGNIGLDRGTKATETISQIFGNYDVALTSNYSGIKAGSSLDEIIIPTLPIVPNNGTIGLANETSTVSSGNDQRGMTRANDTGAVEIAWARYDANGGNFNLTELSSYTGSSYYEGAQPTTYDDIRYIGGAGTILNGLSDLDVERTGYTFLGWSTNSGATAPDAGLAAGTSFAFPATGETYYAVWALTIDYTVTYHGNGETSGTAPMDAGSPYVENTPITILAKGDLEKEHYAFLGWSTNASDTVADPSYAPGATFPITSDLDLYAIWAEDTKYTITYHGNGHTEGTEPIDSKSPYYENSQVTILDKESLIKKDCEFLGWSIDPNGTAADVAYAPGAAVSMTGNIDLYAVWKTVPVNPQPTPTPGNTGSTGTTVKIPKTGNGIILFAGAGLVILGLATVIMKKKLR